MLVPLIVSQASLSHYLTSSPHPSPGLRPPSPLAARGEGRVRGVVAVLQCFVASNCEAKPISQLPGFCLTSPERSKNLDDLPHLLTGFVVHGSTFTTIRDAMSRERWTRCVAF